MYLYLGNSSVRFCEANPQWANIFSNLFFFISAYCIKNINCKGLREIYQGLILVGIGSIALHFLDDRFGQLLDELYMVLLMDTIISKLTINVLFNKLYSSFNYAFFFLYVHYKMYNIFLTIFTIQVAIVFFLLTKKTYRKFWLLDEYLKIVFLMLIGIASWIIEQNYCLLHPKIYLLHSLWHFTSAFSVYYLSRFIYRS